MRRKFENIQELREVFLAERYILLDQEYKNNSIPMKMICPNGHFITKTFAEWKRGSRCKECSREGTIIQGLKKCNICGEWKSIKKFYRRRDRKGGFRPQCIKCNENINKKEYNENINRFRNKNKRYYHSPLSFYDNSKVRKEIELYEDIRKSVNDNVECKCAYCGEWFEPKTGLLRHRIYAGDGKITLGSEIRLYCSDKCKENCPIYNQRLHPKDQKPATSREVQPQLRQLVFERDNYTCQKCGYHKDELEVGIHCHHIYPLNEDPIESADMDNCITYCENCHKWIHQNIPGCGYGEMRCSY